jgi:hypothetical protein
MWCADSDNQGTPRLELNCRCSVSCLLGFLLWMIFCLHAVAGERCHGYRKQGIRADYATGLSWAIYSSCIHPEAPWVAVPLHMSYSKTNLLETNRDQHSTVASSEITSSDTGIILPEIRAAAPAPARDPVTVRTGDRVRLWSRSAMAHVELDAVALENGALGTTIRLRTMPGAPVLRGTVRAEGSVELEPPGFAPKFSGGQP